MNCDRIACRHKEDMIELKCVWAGVCLSVHFSIWSKDSPSFPFPFPLPASLSVHTHTLIPYDQPFAKAAKLWIIKIGTNYH